MDLVFIIIMGVTALTIVWCMADAKGQDKERRRREQDNEST